MIIYVVKPGDTIYAIARRYGMSPGKIITDNGLTNPGNLVIGQTLVLMTDTIPHTVKKGDTLYSIARANGVTLAQLKGCKSTDKKSFQIKYRSSNKCSGSY